MLRSYEYGNQQRRHSIIQEKDGNSYSVIAIPSSGKTADTRFFGKGKDRVFVVKRPKYYSKYGPFDEETIKKIDLALEAEYRREQEVWNLVYPDNKADLFTVNGLRLVLPCLPGETLSVSLSKDELICCQQLLSVAYAVQHFNQLGFKYGDFNTDNVLIEQKPNGTFRAYLIDFNSLRNINDEGGNQELAALNILVLSADWRSKYTSIDALIDGLITKINTLTDERSCAEKLCESISSRPER